MFAVLAEDSTDADCLEELVKRITGRRDRRVLKKGFSGCGELKRKSPAHIKLFLDRGATRFILCQDSDGSDPDRIRSELRKVVKKVNSSKLDYEIVVPVQELEAWVIADEQAIAKVIPSLSIKSVRHPETQSSPKEWLVGESARGRSRPLYSPVTHNVHVVRVSNLETLQQKCPSFVRFSEFVKRR
jgi:hypothetical protein